MRIGIRKAHTQGSTGASSYLNEWSESRAVFPKVVELLKPYHTIVDCTPPESSGYGEWNIGVNTANNSNLDLFFSIHFNSGAGDPQGVEACVYPTDITGASYGTKICANIAKLGFKNRGVKNRSDLAETCNIKCPSLVIETCFVQETDGKKYKEVGVEKIARAIANAIDNRISLDIPHQNSNTASLSPAKEVFRVRTLWDKPTSQIGAYSVLNNAISECKKAGANYKVYDSKGIQVYPEIIAASTNILKTNYAEIGRATVIISKLNVRDSYDYNNSKVVATYSYGESFNYTHVYITKDNRVWVYYISNSGYKRYVCVKDYDGTRLANCI